MHSAPFPSFVIRIAIHTIRLAWLSIVSLVVTACSQDRSQELVDMVVARFTKPDSGIATRALPAPGTMVPPFEYPSLRPFIVTSKRWLVGQPVVLALWSVFPGGELAMQQFDSLARQYNDSRIRFVVLADHPNSPALDTLLRAANWRYRVDMIGIAHMQLNAFDVSHWTPRVNGRYGEFRLPSFLLLSEDGHVIRRAAGPPYDVFRPALDSLRKVADATTPAEDSATVAAIRPHLEQALLSFSPEKLGDWTFPGEVRLDGTCATQETSPVGIIPATGRLLDIQATAGVVRATVEFVWVAYVVPEEYGDVCAAERVSIRHRVGVDTLRMSLEIVPPGDTLRWAAMGALHRPEGHPRPSNVALFGTGYRRGQIATLWPGMTMEILQDRVDSIRRARGPARP